MEKLNEVVREEVRKYAGSGRGANIILFPVLDDERQIYAVMAIDYPAREESAGVVVLARLVDEKVVIEEDATNKKLVDALLQRGIRRERIILAYAGEPIPDAAVFEQ
ncbi:MAG: element excision factor XisI family protein [bacterium]|nr:element excision factor XisI family protein [bacterium]